MVKHTSIRIILDITTMKNLKLEQLDVKTAFLLGSLDEKIYMTQPEGFEHGYKSIVCLLKKSFYGLKDSPRQWYRRFDEFMIKQGFSRSKHESCVNFSKLKDNSYIYLLIYVDNMLIAYNNQADNQKLKLLLKS